MDRSLVMFNPSQLAQLKSSIQKRRQKVETLQQDMHSTMEREMALERQAVQDAVKRYNGKAMALMKSEQMKAKQRELEDVSDELSDMLEQISFSVNRYVRKIQRDPSLKSKEKARFVREMEDRVNETCLSDSQCQQLKQMKSLVQSLQRRGALSGDRSDEEQSSDGEESRFSDTVVL